MGTGKTYSTDYLVDSNGNTGVAGQILVTTATGVNWQDAENTGDNQTQGSLFDSKVVLIDTPNGGLKPYRVITDEYGEWIQVGRFAANAMTTIQGTWSSVSGLSTGISQSETTSFSADFGDSFPDEVRVMGATDFNNWRNTRTIDWVYKVPEGRKWKYFFSGGATNGMTRVPLAGTPSPGTRFGWGVNGAYDGFGRWTNVDLAGIGMSDGNVNNPSAAYTTATSNAFNWDVFSDAKLTVNAFGIYSGQDQGTTSLVGSDDATNAFYDTWPTETSNATGGTEFSSAVWVLIKLPGGASGSGGGGGYWAANGNDIYNTNSANVGIGTDAPKGKLHVLNGTAGTYTPDSESDTLVVESDAPGGISLIGTGTASASKQSITFGTLSDINSARIVYDSNNSFLSIGTTTTGNYVKFLTGNGSESMRITSTQEVGINKTTSLGSHGLSILKTASNQQLGCYYNETNFAAFGARSNGDVQIYGYNGAVGGTGLANILLGVDGSAVGGNVGIGTVSPSLKLEVQGTASTPTPFGSAAVNGVVRIASGGTNPILDIGSNSAAPYEMWLQAHVPANTYGTPISLQPLGGSVGIGTTGPSATLHVARDADGGVAEIILENSFTNTASSTDEITQIQGRFGGWDGSYIITGKEGDYTTAALRKSYLAFSTRTATTGMTEKMRIDAAGMVGIGIIPGNGFGLARLSLGTGAVANEIIAFASASGGNAELRNTSSTGTFTFTNSDGSSNLLRILANGNVGIGNTSPRDKLTVFTAGTAEEEIGLRLVNPIGFTNAGSGASIIFAQDRSVGENLPMAKIRSAQSIGGTSSYGDLIFSTLSTTMQDRMTILSGGNVGIGTSAPGAKLEVAGNITTPTQELSTTATPTSFGIYSSEIRLINTPNGGLKKCRVITDNYGEWILVGRFAANAMTTVQSTWSSESGLDTSTSQSTTTKFSADFGDSYPTEVRIMGATDFDKWRDTRTVDFVYGVPEGRQWKFFFSNGSTTGMGIVDGIKYGWTVNGAYDGFGRWVNPSLTSIRMGDIGTVPLNPSSAFTTATTNAFYWNAMSDAKFSVSATRTFCGQDTFVTSGFGIDDSIAGFFDEYPNEVTNMQGGADFSSAVWILIKLPNANSGGGSGGDNLWSANGTNIYNTNLDNVGIGTDSPGTAKLFVQNPNASTNPVFQTKLDTVYGMGMTSQWVSQYVSKIQIGRIGTSTSQAEFIYDIAGTEYASIKRNYTASSLKFERGTALDMIIGGTGNVGIGLTNPAYKLVVYETGTATSNIAIDARATGAGTNNYAVWAQGSGASSTNFAFYGAAGKNAFLGDTGIGTDSPDALLSLGSTAGQKFYVYSDGSTVKAGMGIDLSGSQRELSIFNSSSNGFSDGNISFGYRNESNGAYQERMRLLSGGNLGIGITTPYTKLVIGSRGTAAAPSILAYDGIAFDFYNDGPPYKRHGVIISQAGDASESVLDFNTKAASGTNSTKMTILGNGNVGIGNTSPDKLLHVGNGSAQLGFPQGAEIEGYNNTLDLRTNEGNSIADFTAALNLFCDGVVGSSGTGTGIYFRAKTGGGGGGEYTTGRIQGAIYTSWTTNTDATRTSKLVLQTTNSGTHADRVTILGNGDFGINDTSPSNKLDVNGDVRATQYKLRGNVTNPTTTAATIYDQATVGLTLSAHNVELRNYNGSAMARSVFFTHNTATFTGTCTATNFILSSDKALKDNIREIDTKHIDVEWKNFELKSEPGVKRSGVIAQGLEKKHPEFVRTDKEGLKSVAYIDLLIAKIAELEARLEKAGI